MKFQVKGTDLNNVLSTVIKGFNAKEDNSYIGFELKGEEKKLKITARSRSSYFEGEVNADSIEIEGNEPTTYHLDGVKLKQLVSILPSTPVNVTFEITEKTRSFTIKTMVSKYKLPVLSETPLAPKPETNELSVVDANEFMKVVKDLIKIVSTDASTQEHQVSCMHFNMKNERIKVSATDSYALGSVEVKAEKVSEDDLEENVLVRHTEVGTLLKGFDQGTTITVVSSKDMFGYVDEDGTLSLVGVINLTPLDTSQIEEFTKDDNKITVEKQELTSAIETVAKLSPNDEAVDIEFKKDGDLRVSNRYGDYIDVTPSLNEVTSPGIASFSTSILLKSITPANNGSIRLELGQLEKDEQGVIRVVSLQTDGSVDKGTSLLATRLAV